nr:hypothetical protein [Tanacetum cinerariifolium]
HTSHKPIISPDRVNDAKPFAVSAARVNAVKPSAVSAARVNAAKPFAVSAARVNAAKPSAVSAARVHAARLSAVSAARVNAVKPSAVTAVLHNHTKKVWRPKTLVLDHVFRTTSARFDANMRFLLKSKEEIEKEEDEIIKSINETPAQTAAKRRRLRKQAKEDENLKKQLESNVNAAKLELKLFKDAAAAAHMK